MKIGFIDLGIMGSRMALNLLVAGNDLTINNLAEKIHIDLSDKDLDGWLAILSSLRPIGKTSMLQDIEAARKTEVEIFAGKVVSLGKEYNVPTPANSIILQIIKAMEHKYTLDHCCLIN